MTKYRNIPTDKLLDELLGIHLEATGRPAPPKPTIKYCVKVTGMQELGDIEPPKLHCETHVIETKKMGI